MFTGIVRELGRVVSAAGGAAGRALVVEASEDGCPARSGRLDLDQRVLPHGRVHRRSAGLDARGAGDAGARRRSARLSAGDAVNVEPALRAGEPLGGHYVQGHVDAVGRVQSVEAEGDGLRVFVEASADVLRYCVEKGSVTVDGVSLTVAEVGTEEFAVALVPHTLEATTLSALAPGQEVNLEVDVLAKYVERLLGARGLRSEE